MLELDPTDEGYTAVIDGRRIVVGVLAFGQGVDAYLDFTYGETRATANTTMRVDAEGWMRDPQRWLDDAGGPLPGAHWADEGEEGG